MFGKIAIVSALALSTIFVASPSQAAMPKYKACADMQKVYPYGVKLKGAVDKVNVGRLPTTGSKQITAAEFNVNKSLDYDGDKFACEIPKYKNCFEANKIFIHGAGLRGAVDSTSTKPVTNFYQMLWAPYITNSHMDRDGDKIFCEK